MATDQPLVSRSKADQKRRKSLPRLGRAVVREMVWALCPSSYLSHWVDRRLRVADNFWLFVLGVNNSGTTVLAEILESHASIRGLPAEGHYLTKALPIGPQFGVERGFGLRPDIFRWTEESPSRPALRARYDWSWHYPRTPGILLEKSPPNTLRARWLQRNFQPSRFVAIVRHPYAVCEGTRRRVGNTIQDAADQWRRANEYLFEDIPHLQHCLWFRYEDLCGDPEAHLVKLESFLELEKPFDKDVLASLKSHNMDNATSALQNFNARSISRLSGQDIQAINQIAGTLMEHLGYERL